VFDHVSFSYPGAAEPVLRDIVLDLTPGQTLVLTGATGSGKSTLLQLASGSGSPWPGPSWPGRTC
jgi:ABC-type bacteriocin/lantibiotic exporter with double-glycine peptidase domain